MTNGSYTIYTSNTYVEGTLHWELTGQSVENNTSDIHVWLTMIRTNSGFETYGTGDFWIGIDDQVIENKGLTFSITEHSDTTMADGTFTVSHNADGTAWIIIKCGGTTDDLFTMEDFQTDDGEIELPAITRADTPYIADETTLGEAVTITIDCSNDFTHTLICNYNGTTETIANDVGGSYTWTPPLTLAAAVPNDAAATCLITCITYNGATEIGRKETSTLLHIPADVVPSVSISSITDTPTGMSEKYGGYLQNYCCLQICAEACGIYGSTIQKLSVQADNHIYEVYDTDTISITTDSLKTVGTSPITVTAADSRGRQNVISQNIVVLQYYTPVIFDAAIWRCQSDGTADDDGNYCRVQWTDAVRQLENYSRNISVKYKKVTDTAYTTFNGTFTQQTSGEQTQNITAPIPMSSDYAYDILITVSDALNTITKPLTLSTGYTIMDIDGTGKSIAFGKVANRDGLEIALPLTVSKDAVFTQKLQTNQLNLSVGGLSAVQTGSFEIVGDTSNGWTTKDIYFEHPFHTNPWVFIQQTGGNSIENARAFNMRPDGFKAELYACEDFTATYDWIAFEVIN